MNNDKPISNDSTLTSGVSILLEIGTEEIPARFLPPAIEMLKELTRKHFDNSSILFDSVTGYATPNRLVMIAGGVSEYQETKVKEYFGPPKIKAFDENGNPTRAAEGFARGHGIVPEKLVIKKKGKGEYAVAVIEEKGMAVADLLGDIFVKIITSLHFPKVMKWGDGDFRFARPIQWITSLCGEKTIKFELNQLSSSNRLRGHRFLSNSDVELTSIDTYKDLLREHFVIVDHEERKSLITSQLKDISSYLNASLIEDEELLNTVTFLVEHPHAVSGSFSETFLTLPKELPVIVLRDHQKYFAFENEKKELINRFAVISNSVKENEKNIRSGAERVVRARLEDAKFYYDEDIKIPLIDRVDSLKNLMFYKGIGSMYDKLGRLSLIAGMVHNTLFSGNSDMHSPDIDKVQRAVMISKTDLVTGVVREFPELQGIMGSYYALKNGEDSDVAHSLREQYLPAYSGDKTPESSIGIILSISDKIDNLVSFFSIGLIPTGSEDPLALRRQALGIIAILLHHRCRSALDHIFTEAVVLLNKSNDVKESILHFLKQRLEHYFLSLDYGHDIVNAAMNDFSVIPVSYLINKLDSLKELKRESMYNQFLFSFKRVHNIIPPGFNGEVNVSLFETDYETKLLQTLESVKESSQEAIIHGDYSFAIQSLKQLSIPVSDFFDNVLVMDKDESKKRNRLALLKQIYDFSLKSANFSKLAEN